MDYKEEKNEPNSINPENYEKNCDFCEEEDSGLGGLFASLDTEYRLNNIHPNVLLGFSKLLSKQLNFDPSFKYFEISKILYNILEKNENYEITKNTFHCVYGILNQKDPKYSAELLSFPFEKILKSYIDKQDFVEESFTILKQIASISEYYMLNCMNILPITQLIQYLDEFSSSQTYMNQIFSYVATILTYNVTDDFISGILNIIQTALSDNPYEGVFEVCATLMKKERFNEMQESIDLCKTINDILDKIPKTCLPIAFALIGNPQTTLNYEPNIDFIVHSMICDDQSTFPIRTSAMYCMSCLIDKDSNLANIAFEFDIISILLNTDEQNSFENNEKFILISKLVMNSSPSLHLDLIDSGVFQTLIDFLESSDYHIIMQAIIVIVNSVLIERGLDEVLKLQDEYEVLDIIEKSITEGNETTQEMASNIISQIPHD